MRPVKFFLALFLLVFCFQEADARWIKQESNTLAWLRDVFFLNEKKGWIAGSGGTLFATDDGGKTWIKQKNLTSDVFRQVYFADENNGWLLCERDVYNLGENAPSYLLKTSNAGQNWERVEFTGGSGRERIVRIFFSKNKSGFAVGGTGAFFVERDEKIWKKSPFPVVNAMFDGVFSDESNAVIVGAGGSVFFSENAGATWNKAVLNGFQKAKLNSIFFINSKNGWTVGAGGKIYQTLNGGRLWHEQNSGTASDLTDVFFTTTAEGWTVGEEGTILHTKTAGNVWEKIETNLKHRLEKIIFTGKKGWAVGFGGTILFYDENEAKNENPANAPKLQRRN